MLWLRQRLELFGLSKLKEQRIIIPVRLLRSITITLSFNFIMANNQRISGRQLTLSTCMFTISLLSIFLSN